MKVWGFGVLALALVLGGCASSKRLQSWTPLEARPVGKQAGDTIETIPGVLQAKPVTVVSVVRTFNQAGMLGVCGAVVIAAPKPVLGDIRAYVADRNSELVIAPDAPQPVRMAPSFMQTYTREESGGVLDVAAIDYGALLAGCVVTSLPWKAEYASANRLDLRKTVYVSGGPTYVYLPRHR